MLAKRKMMELAVAMVAIALVLGAGGAVMAENLLCNPGFETGPIALALCAPNSSVAVGWTFQSLMGCPYYYGESVTGPYHPPYAFHSGTDACCVLMLSAGEGIGTLRQETGAVGGGEYTASVWVLPRADDASGFGNASTDWAGLIVEELAADGTVLDTHTSGLTAASDTYQRVSVAFPAKGGTVKLRYLLKADISCFYTSGHVTFDDAVLDGPPVPASLTGTVTGGGSALEGATVELPDQSKSDTTGADGSYTITGLLGGQGQLLIASNTGYYTQRLKCNLNGGETTTKNIDLQPVNLLANAGFDNVWNGGWSTSVTGVAYVVSETAAAQWSPSDARYDSGEEAAAVCTTSTGEGRVYQDATVNGTAEYTVRCRFLAHQDPRFSSKWGTPGDGQDDAALFVQELDRFGQPIGAEQRVNAAETKSWETLQLTFTTNAQTRLLRVGGWALMSGNYNGTLERANFDTFELDGPAGVPLPPLYGVVKAGGLPLPGATVEVAGWVSAAEYYSGAPGVDYTVTADADGYWELNVPAAEKYHTIRCGKVGYYTQATSRTAPEHICSFDLVPENLAANAGFDYSWPAGWTIGWDPWMVVFNSTGRFPVFHSGEVSSVVFSQGAASGNAWMYQDIPVQAGEAYTAKVWIYGMGPNWGWGETLNSAALIVEEYDSAGQQLGTPYRADSDPGMNPLVWTHLTLGFTTNAQTVKVRLKGTAYSASMSDACAFDDFELNGPAGAFGLHGVVRSSGSPVDGAMVRVTDASAVPTTLQVLKTNALGEYTVVSPVFGHYYIVRASKTGNYAQRKFRTVNGDVALDFDLTPIGGNLLLNIGSDDSLDGWECEMKSRCRAETVNAPYTTAVFYHSGEEAVDIIDGENTWYQEVPVVSGSSYTAGCWFRAGEDPRYGSRWGDTGDLQKGALYVEEFDSAGDAIAGTARMIYAAETKDWEFLTTTFATTAQTAKVRVGGYANLVDQANSTIARAIFEDFSLTGPAGASPSLASIKGLPDDSEVRVAGKVVTASFTGSFYIEEVDRSSGIKVSGNASVGSLVTIAGRIKTVDGERTLVPSSYTENGSATVPAPLGLNNRSTLEDGKAIGLYVKAWGRVVNAAEDSFTMTDGSNGMLKVYGTASVDDYVAVTGALGAEMSGSNTVPVLRAVSVEKVTE